MIPVLIISILTIILMIMAIIFFPQIKIGKISFQSYWFVTIIGAIILLLFGFVPIEEVVSELIKDTEVNPIKILTLFISMTILSVYLDELGFFKYLASLAIKKAKCKQISLFLMLYIVTSILTVFTSNDIIILTLTPFICYFCKNAKINPIPYLVSEFVSANTWSMMLVIGNPTNIFLSTQCGIDFISYVKVMAIPTICAGLISFGIIMLLFRKDLKKEMQETECHEEIKDKTLLIIGLVHLVLCTILLAISSYINLQMWIITLGFALSLLLITLIYLFIKRKPKTILIDTLKRAPWTLIPFILSMFIIVLALAIVNLPEIITTNVGGKYPVFTYGILSFLASNVMNNIPMCVFFSKILNCFSGSSVYLKMTYSVIAGSNIGAFLTPIGALAGIMWMSILKKNDVKFSFVNFMKYGFIISIPTILVTMLLICII